MRKLLVFLWLASWLYLSLIPALEAGTPSYLAWQNAGCPAFGSTVALKPCPLAGSFARGLLLWLVTAPILAWALLRTPTSWPARLNNFLWDKERPVLSAATLLVCIGVMASVIVGAVRAPYGAAAITNWVALGPLTLLGFWYRAAYLSASDEFRR